MALYLADAADRNFNKWPTLGTYVWPNNFIGNTYQEEIDYLKTWLVARLNWLDANMYGSCADLSVDSEELDIEIYPNPFNGSTKVIVNSPMENGVIEIRNNLGVLIETRQVTKTVNYFDFNELAKGVYFMNVYNDGILLKTEKLISL